jgi:hypothetical protein
VAHGTFLARRARRAGQTLRTSETLSTGVPILARGAGRTRRSHRPDDTSSVQQITTILMNSRQRGHIFGFFI